jgi:hypothetical protein
MSDAASLWEIHEPFDVGRDDAKALVDVARAVLSGREPADADAVARFLTAPRSAEVAVVLREQGPAIIWRSAKRASLYESVIEGASVLRDRWRVRQLRHFGPLAEALDGLTVEIEVFYDRGRFATRSNDLVVRAIEPGIHGALLEKGTDYRYILPSAAAHRSDTTAMEVLTRASKEWDPKDLEGWRRPQVNLWRFRTIHWREMSPKGPLVRLERGIPPVGEEVLTRRGLTEVLDLATSWLVANQRPDGQYAYKYFPERDQWVGRRSTTAQNIVRHGLAAYGTVLAYEYVEREEYLAAARRAIDFLRANTRRGMGPPTGKGHAHEHATTWEGKPIPHDMRFVEYVDNRDDGLTAKAAATAATILALTELGEVTGWTPELRQEVDEYAKLLLLLQRDDGSFAHYYVASGHPKHGEESTIFPGEILFALSRAYAATDDRRYRDAFARGTRFYEAWYRDEVADRGWDGEYPETVRLDLVQFVPWISMAMNDRVQRETRPSAERSMWIEFGIHGAEWIVREYQYGRSRAFFPDYLGGYFKSVSELPAMHGCVYTEGTAAGYNLARLSGQTERRRSLRRATLLGCRFAAQQLIRPGVSDFYFPNPEAARGGIRYALTDNHLRTDYTYHSLSAIYQALRYMPREDLP